MAGMTGRDLVIAEVVEHLRIGRSTLDQWLANDMLRPVGERRYQCNTFRGAKRVWTETSFQNLRAAIERESLSGGVLARSSSRNVTAIGTPRAPSSPAADQLASEKVSTFPLRPPPSDKRKSRSQSTSMTKRRVSPGPQGAVIRLR